MTTGSISDMIESHPTAAKQVLHSAGVTRSTMRGAGRVGREPKVAIRMGEGPPVVRSRRAEPSDPILGDTDGAVRARDRTPKSPRTMINDARPRAAGRTPESQGAGGKRE